MGSNIYIGAGILDGQRVMKVGKANSIESRQKQIGISIECFRPCRDEEQAFKLETRLRDFVKNSGARSLRNHNDWFHYDADIYDGLRRFLTDEVWFEILSDYNGGVTSIDQLEEELLRLRYYRSIYEDMQREATLLREALWGSEVKQGVYAILDDLSIRTTRVEVKVELYESGDIALTSDDLDVLREEIRNIRTELLAYRTCGA